MVARDFKGWTLLLDLEKQQNEGRLYAQGSHQFVDVLDTMGATILFQAERDLFRGGGDVKVCRADLEGSSERKEKFQSVVQAGESSDADHVALVALAGI